MSTLQESFSKVRELLLDPVEQSPTVKQVFGSVLREMQNISNELNNTSQNWTTAEFNLNLNGSYDYLISNGAGIGKILFVTNQYNNYYAPVEFTDLADISNDWWLCNVVERPFRDDYFNRFPAKIAFYRKNGQLYARTAPNYYLTGQLTVTAAVGDWSTSKTLESSQVMRQYHHLPEIRSALNLLPACEWSDATSDEIKRRNLGVTLAAQEDRVYRQFREAKRNMVADEVSFRDDEDDF